MADSQSAQQAHAERALAQKMEMRANAATRPDNSPSAHEGMRSTPRDDYPPSGAFDAEGHEPALRRSRER